MQELRVTIVMPVYSVSAYIERTLVSVMNQTYASIDCIIVDDDSPDDSIEKCERLIADYHGPIRFFIIHHERNRGLSAARNTGIEAAIGDYLFFLDSDDALAPDCLEKLIKPLDSDPSIEMVAGSFVRHPDGYSLTSKQRQGVQLEERDLCSSIAVRGSYFNRGFYANAWNKLINKDFILRNQLYFKEGYLWEDILWTFFVMKYLKHLYTIPDVTYHQYKRPQSITTGIGKEEKAWYMGKVYEEIANHFTLGEEAREANFFLRGFCVHCSQATEHQSYHRASHQFRVALSDGHHKLDLMLLYMTLFLSKYAIGRKIFNWGKGMRLYIKNTLNPLKRH